MCLLGLCSCEVVRWGAGKARLRSLWFLACDYCRLKRAAARWLAAERCRTVARPGREEQGEQAVKGRWGGWLVFAQKSFASSAGTNYNRL